MHRYTTNKDSNGTNVFAIFFNWSRGIVPLHSPKPTNSTTIELIGEHGVTLNYVNTTTGINVHLPDLHPADTPSKYAWVLKMTRLQNANLKPVHTEGPYRGDPINIQETDTTKH